MNINTKHRDKRILILSIEINSHAALKGGSIYSRNFLNYEINEVLLIFRITLAHWECQKNFLNSMA